MNLRIAVSSVLITATSLALNSCGSDPQIVPTDQVSVGQQLNDLDNARRQEIITEREYQRLKKALINRYD